MQRPVRDGRRRRALAGVLGALFVAGCQTRPERVVLRLGPADFAGGVAAPHEPVVQIGDEARPVLVAPKVIAVADLPAPQMVDGVVRAPVVLPEDAAVLADGAFRLTVLRREAAEEDEILKAAGTLHWKPVDDWRLVRPTAGARDAVVEMRVPPAFGERFVLHLEALGPTPQALASRPFDPPRGGRLVLGYGVDGVPSTGAVHFRAQLECEGVPPRTITTDALAPAPDSAGAWREAIVGLPSGATGCRVVLSHDAPPDGTAHGVWTPPYVLARGSDAPTPRNVVVISLDTLRGDHLSGYGYRRATSPAIDTRLIGKGTAFVDASTTFPLTSYGHMSLFTGLYADALPSGGSVPPDSPVRVLAEVLRDAGFETAAYTEDALLAGFLGFWHGFARFTERPFVAEARGRDTFRDGARFAAEHRDRRFFLFLHTYKVHSPYESGPAYATLFTDAAEWSRPDAPSVPADSRAAMDAYDRAIREADDQVAAFLDALEESDLADDTLVVLLSDHGEAFGEHGQHGHGLAGYQEQLVIPLVLRGPGVPSRRVSTPVSLVDVVPTILDLLGLPALAQAQGISLRPAVTGGTLPADRPIFFNWIGRETAGVRRGSEKYLSSKTKTQRFDLARDPGERQPLAGDDHELAAVLAAARAQHLQVRERLVPHTRGVLEGAVLPDRIERSLRALGYL